MSFTELQILFRKLALKEDLQESLLEIALRWAKHDADRRKFNWVNIVSLLNWEKISAKYIQEKILTKDDIYDCDVIASYIFDKLTLMSDVKDDINTDLEATVREQIDSIINDSWSTVVTRVSQKQTPIVNNVLKNGECFSRALMFGGSKRKKDIYVFDSETHTIEKVGETEQYLQHHRCERVSNHAYIFGGYDKLMEGQVSSAFLKYDISNKTITTLPYKMAAPRFSFASCIIDNTIYAFGGKQGSRTVAVTEKFSLEKMRWFKGKGTETVKDHGFDAIVAKNAIYLTPGGLSALIRRYDPREGKIKQLGKIPTGRYLSTSCRNGDSIYVCGGYSNVSRNECHLYDLRNNCWKTLPSLPIPIYGARSLFYNNSLYVLGGAIDEIKGTNRIQMLDIPNNKWSILDVRLQFFNDSFSLITY
uniref:BACK domain-containing protein n=1 Tax=Strongyloides papillosus TaxID=174720 RepID=A0A0N5C6Y8_STREA